jgi:hypothetical protein
MHFMPCPRTASQVQAPLCRAGVPARQTRCRGGSQTAPAETVDLQANFGQEGR